MIFGLPLSLFALMMIAILLTLLIIIFSFGLGIMLGLVVFDILLYIGLTKIAHTPSLFQWDNPFPKVISNKRNSGMYYEKN